MRTRGFSIIEVIASLTILFLILGGMLGLFWQGFNSVKKSQDYTVAYSLAREKLEEKITVSPWPPVSEAQAAVPGFTGFERAVAITCPYLGFNDLAYIQVRVFWNNGNQFQEFEVLKANF